MANAFVEMVTTFSAEIDVRGFCEDFAREFMDWLAEDDDWLAGDDPNDDLRREFVQEALSENGRDVFYQDGVYKSWVITTSTDEDVWVRTKP